MKTVFASGAENPFASSGLARDQTESDNHTLEIVIAVIFNLDPSAFFAVVNGDAGSQMLLQAILQLCHCRRGNGQFARALAPQATDPKLPRHQPFRGANSG